VSHPHLVSLAEHPAAACSIRRIKACGGLAGYGIALGGGLVHGAELVPALERACVAGIVAYLLTWACAIAAWRRVLAGQAAAAVKRSRARTAAAPGTAE
jgi:hypothetical protein